MGCGSSLLGYSDQLRIPTRSIERNYVLGEELREGTYASCNRARWAGCRGWLIRVHRTCCASASACAHVCVCNCAISPSPIPFPLSHSLTLIPSPPCPVLPRTTKKGFPLPEHPEGFHVAIKRIKKQEAFKVGKTHLGFGVKGLKRFRV